MPYGPPITTIQSVATDDLSPVDQKPYWIKVRTQVKVREFSEFAAVAPTLNKWAAAINSTPDDGVIPDMPQVLAETYAKLITSWNLEDPDDVEAAEQEKRPPKTLRITAAAVNELMMDDLTKIGLILASAISGGAATKEAAVKNESGSTSGSETSAESSHPTESSALALTSASTEG